MGWLKDLDDASFLKPIYMVAIISPLMLMTRMPLLTTSRANAPLYQLVNVRISNCSQTCQCLRLDKQLMRAPPLDENPTRRCLEHEILRIVVDMAARGPSVFHQGITSLVKEWSPLLLGQDFVPSLTTLLEGPEKNHGDLPDGRMSPVLSARIEQLSDVASPPPAALVQGSSAPPSVEYTQAALGVRMGNSFTRSLVKRVKSREQMKGTDEEPIARAIRVAFHDAVGEAAPHTPPSLSRRTPPPTPTTAALQGDQETMLTPPSPQALSTQSADRPTSKQCTPPPSPFALVGTTPDGSPLTRAQGLQDVSCTPTAVSVPAHKQCTPPPSPFALVGTTPDGSPLISAQRLQDVSHAPTVVSVPSQVGSDEESSGSESTDDSEEDDTSSGEDYDENPTSKAPEPNEELPGEAEETPGSPQHSDDALSELSELTEPPEADQSGPDGGALVKSTAAFSGRKRKRSCNSSGSSNHLLSPRVFSDHLLSPVVGNDALGLDLFSGAVTESPTRGPTYDAIGGEDVVMSDPTSPTTMLPDTELEGPDKSMRVRIPVKSADGTWFDRWITRWPLAAVSSHR